MTDKNELASVNAEAEAVCKRIQHLIDVNHTSYGRVAEKTGIPKSAVHRYATGQTTRIPMERIELIAKAFGVSAAWLMGWSDQEKMPSNLDDKVLRLVEIMQGLSDEELDKLLDYAQLLRLRRDQ